jgi:hypothetical protein
LQHSSERKLVVISKMRLFETLAAFALLLPSAYMYTKIDDEEIKAHVLWAALASLACYASTVWLVPTAASYLLKRGLAGKDRGKMGTEAGSKDIPSALGLICGVVYMVFIIVTQLVYAKKNEADNHGFVSKSAPTTIGGYD